MEFSDPVDTPMVEKSKLDEDTQGKAVDPTHYRGMIGTLMYLTARTVNLGRWYPKDSSIALTDVILQEKLVNISRLITNIESLKDNPTPDHVFKSSSSFPIPVTDSDSFFEESDTSFSHSGNSLPEFETFSDHTKETRSGNTTTYANNSLPKYDSFLFEVEHDQEELISIVISDNSNDPLLEGKSFGNYSSQE
ncbi:hypothetical protein Tco_1235104 [Tanacetum coccineum]